MKLIFCKECSDVVRLTTEKIKQCDCGKSSGQYTDNLYAWYKGPCIPLGFANSSFLSALRNQPEKDWGETFTAFVIEKECKTFKNKNKDE
jgi:hypothetical protein